MAGGMTPSGRENHAQRTQTTDQRETARGHSTAGFHGTPPAAWADALTDAMPADQPPPVKHCWYDGPHGRQPALLLGWRNTGGHYDGRIAVAAPEPDGWAIVEMWVSQGMLSPA